MQQIIAIGGGGFASANSELKFERYILDQVKANANTKVNDATSAAKINDVTPRPTDATSAAKVCFLPQASNEDQEYVVKFFESFTKLGANPTWLSLFGKVKPEWKQMLLEQDVIYVGGGNTKSMLALWRDWQLDVVLKQAYQNGVILAGVSAGAICWFEQALTDSVWPLGVIPGLGWLSGSCCPHYDGELERKPAYAEKLAAGAIVPGIAIEDHVAVHFVDGKISNVVSSVAGKQAYLVSNTEHKAIAAQVL